MPSVWAQLWGASLAAVEVTPAALTVLLAVAVCLLLFRGRGGKYAGLKLPPGPAPLPLIGNLHQISVPPWGPLSKLAKIYGDVMFLRFGALPVVVLSSPAAVKAFLVDNGRLFADRSPLYSMREGGRDHHSREPYAAGVIFSNGDVWKAMRRVMNQNLFVKARLPWVEHFVVSETRATVNTKIPELARRSPDGAVGIHSLFHELSGSMMLRIIVGEAFKGESDPAFVHFRDNLHEYERCMTAGYLGDYFPILNYFPSPYRATIDRIMVEQRATLMAMVEKLKQRRAAGEELAPCVATAMLDLVDKEPLLKRASNFAEMLVDLQAAGLDTSGNLTEWTVTVLANEPEVQETLRDEVAKMLGDRAYSDDDAANMPYLTAVINETMRLISIVPLNLPHSPTGGQAVRVGDYDIPGDVTVFANFWHIFHDPQLWPDPEKFSPERFLNAATPYDPLSRVDVRFSPFAVGTRQCPGARVGFNNVATVVSMLLQTYRLKRPTVAKFSYELAASLVASPKYPASIVFEPLVNGSKAVKASNL